ncbi:hypothetical protein E3N88_17692 [Mikania micrantha]|uniref:Retrotransposon Copia-like N-terminal domain-containing protein n=1 Tax=Mikania micrantha TaxID=192012 RepID=A0A5N6NSK4_9ASTR|nr:hypothetical protein E3N88_17692 [Mikania micrantha]
MVLLASFTTAEKTNHNSHKFGFTLSSTNYGYWKTMIQPFLITNKLFGYIDGSIPCAFQHVQGNTSRELWLALECAFAPNTTLREYTLKQKLLRIQMQLDETTTAYLTRAQEYADALANIGEPVKEKDLVMMVLTGLREEYNSLKSTILARQHPTAFCELNGLISDHDYMIKKAEPPSAHAFHTTISRPSTSSVPASPLPADTITALQQIMSQLGLQVQPQSSTPHAMFASRGRGRGYSQRGRGRNPLSFNTNHNANRGQFTWASTHNMVYGTCNRCGIGHIPSQCPHRYQSLTIPHRSSAAAAMTNTCNNEIDNTLKSHDKAINDIQAALSALMKQQEQSSKQQEEILKAVRDKQKLVSLILSQLASLNLSHVTDGSFGTFETVQKEMKKTKKS